MRNRLALLALCGLAVLGVTAATAHAEPGENPRTGDTRHGPSEARDDFVVIGHRGASGYRPEHTLASYELAARMGADYIEPDLVTTKDGVLVARHEPEIGGTTDVARRPEFADRETTKIVDGQPVTGWFAEDFTLAELKTLRAVERIPGLRPNNTIYDGRFEVPTLQEVVDLSRRLSRELGRSIGLYIETKHPTYFAEQDLALEPALVQTLRRNGLNRPNADVYVQSFEVGNLRQLDRWLRVPLVQLIGGSGAPYDFVHSGDPRTYDDLLTREGLAEVATYADGLGPAKDRVIPREADGTLGEPSSLVTDAHRAGLVVHPWTFRAENEFLPTDLRSSGDPAAWGDIFAEYEAFLATGIDGVFADHPDIAVEATRALRD
ncbi:glycerophosphodiester phosphodiesterase [Saccharomonospora piscinae]|uniref:glycerophosphodiester phosphodiesterase n=1 Tax=Saccharomonospora piscinae TaxID=687388 RepID=A0A1V9A0J9_SACPI|nr:glycerophosphodiester phosphodiesterase [Saccharomonospora piscinae]OQO90558.1 glycerophosphodiester phosphodiesterase [Saccharomonospora piscinae]